MSHASMAVGIDLGTTHCALALCPLQGREAPAVIPVPQVVQPGEVESRPLLPSFLYLPSEHELQGGALALPWDKVRGFAVGSFARQQGTKVPVRLVHSAKSWLSVPSHDGPRAAFLPWQAPEGVTRVSPVEASARYLAHLKEALHAHDPKALSHAEVVLTVPASFDVSARELTVEAAQAAGLPKLTLLEEPQAAVYAWLAAQGDEWRKHLKAKDVLLVVDVGGGTTDFSLISVTEEQGNLVLERVAVGDHILLGGDNMDLALAHHLKAGLEAAGKTLDDAQMLGLTFACRDAKEQLFSDPRTKKVPIAVAGRGSSLMGSTVRTELTREVLLDVLVDGFFPRVDAKARALRRPRTGLATLGLPYAQEAGITRHLAEFLGRHQAPGQGGTFVHPTCVLFNGGVFKASALQDRILEVLNGWLAAENAAPVRVLAGQDLDHAVAKGAAAYARFRALGGLRIRGGAARAYYVGIELSAPAVPGMEAPLKAVCVTPLGMEEGTQADLPEPLGLVTGEPARFRFFSSTSRKGDKVGDAVARWKDELVELPAIEATADGAQGQLVPVQMRARVTEMGTLDLSCVDKAGKTRARFEFNVRAEE